MNIWWISIVGKKLTITMFECKRSVGPYWSEAEALRMIKRWR